LADVSSLKEQLSLGRFLSLWSLTYRNGFMSFDSAGEGKGLDKKIKMHFY